MNFERGSENDAEWDSSESARLSHRYLDLRRPQLQRNLAARARVGQAMRNALHAHQFREVETPSLFRSTPEGAREFLVPTRQPGQFYALVQSPQQLKQLLMVGGIERYYQFARCYRDESGRADRQAEFTQLDLECAWARGEDVQAITEAVLRAAWDTMAADARAGRVIWPITRGLPERLPRLSYAHVMCRYGSDKPDRRLGLSLRNVARALPSAVNFAPFAPAASRAAAAPLDGPPAECLEALAPGQAAVLCMRVPGGAQLSRSQYEKAVGPILKSVAGLGVNTPGEWATGLNSSVVATAKVGGDGSWTAAGGLGKAIPVAEQAAAAQVVGAAPGDLLLFSAGAGDAPYKVLGSLRTALATSLVHAGIPLVPATELSNSLLAPGGDVQPLMPAHDPGATTGIETDAFWVEHFPLFEVQAADDGGIYLAATHHPFTSPIAEHVPTVQAACAAAAAGGASILQDVEWVTKLATVQAEHYDVVVNGMEIGGGSARVHDAALQRAIMTHMLSLPAAQVASFEHLLHALACGAPPHAGIALGFDRLMTVLCGAASVRDVIAFPKSAGGRDLLAGTPAPVTPAQLTEYHIAVEERG